MVKVAQRGRFSVYVERGGRHHAPHCHVDWKDGSATVQIRSIRLLGGKALPTQARRLVEDHMDGIVAAWNQLNPEQPIQ